MKFELPPEIERDLIRKIAGRMALKIQGEIKRRTPVITGIARNSVVVNEDALGYIIGTNLKYWQFIEEDTKPHLIKPRFAKALRFEYGDEVVLTKKVKHPGTEGYHIFKEISKDEQLLTTFLKESIKEVIG